MLATAESCTGGMIAAAITDVPGSSPRSTGAS
jgi:nicotinamide mononucleotide (NMN) deamidase PncC